MSVDASVKGQERAARVGVDTAKPGSANLPTLPEVFDAHAAFVGRTLRLLGVRERELADALQDVFLVVHRRLPELRKPSSLRSWLYAICVRKAMSLRRKAARRKEHVVAELPEEVDGRTPHDDLVRTRALAQAIEILGDLDDDKRAVFVLYEVEQMPMSEVAHTVRVPLQTAYSRLYAARKQISRQLKRLKARGTVAGSTVAGGTVAGSTVARGAGTPSTGDDS